MRMGSTLAFVAAAGWIVTAFLVPFELLLSIIVLFAVAAAGFGLRWYAEVLQDRAAAEQGQNEVFDDEGDITA